MTALLLGVVAACTGERGRPGPPALAIQVPPGSTVFSPDTLQFTVQATDPDGLDSVTVMFLDSTSFIDTGFRSEVSHSFRWPVRAGMPAGRVLPIAARATDLKGLAATQTASITVVSRSVATPSRR